MMFLLQQIEYETQSSTINYKKIDHLTSKFFKHADKIITAIIFVYKFTNYAEFDDLMQEARIALLTAINKNQFDQTKGSLFNFVSMVTSRNLINFTKKNTRYLKKNFPVDLDTIFNNNSLTYVQDFEKELMLDDLLKILLFYFEGKEKFEELSYLLIEFYRTHRSTKFIKKHFVAFAKAYNYSPSIINTFLSMIKRSVYTYEVKEFLRQCEADGRAFRKD